MPASRRLLSASLAAASLTLVGCARPGFGAAPTASWESPKPTPLAPSGASSPVATPQPTPAVAAGDGTPSAAPASAGSPAPAAPASASARANAGSVEPSRSPGPTAAPATRTATPRAAGPVLLGRGSTASDRVRDLQARLAQLGWFSGRVTGNYADATVRAVSDFQAKRGLPVTGAVDQATLDKLVAMSRVPTRAELGLEPTAAPTPGAPTARATAPTAKPAPTATAGAPTAKASASTAKASASAGIDPRCMTGRVLCISKAQNKLRWMVDGEVKQTFAVRFGTDEMPTREGTFSVGWKSRDHVSTIYHTPMPYAMFFSGGQAVHYSADFAARGYNGGSHGCVNVRDKQGIAALFDVVQEGDRVVIYR